MKKNNKVSIMAALALALGATASSKFPNFSEATATIAMASEYSNNAPSQGKATAKTNAGSSGRVQPTDDGYKPPRQARQGQCGEKQASGGQKGDRRIFKFPATKGKKTIKIVYDMLRIPDKLQVFYKGKKVVDTGFVSGTGIKSVLLDPNSTEVTIIIIGNPTNAGTLWGYLVTCPQ